MNNGLYGLASRSSGLLLGLNGIQQNTIATPFRYGRNIQGVNNLYWGCYSPYSKLMYANGYPQNNITIIDPTNDTYIGSFLANRATIAVEAVGNKLFFSDISSTLIEIYDVDTRSYFTALNLGGTYHGYSIRYFPATDRIYVCGYNNQRIYVINPNTNALVSTITPAFVNPIDITLCTTNNSFYVCNYSNSSVSVYNSAFTLITTIGGTGVNPYTIIYCPLNDRVYVANYTSNSISVINPTTNTLQQNITGVNNPLGIYYNPIEQVIVVNETATPSAVVKISPTSNTIISKQLVATTSYYSIYSEEFNKSYALQANVNNPQIIYIE